MPADETCHKPIFLECFEIISMHRLLGISNVMVEDEDVNKPCVWIDHC
jgi:hypothetical protein